MKFNKTITKEQVELIKKLKIIEIEKNRYVICLKFVPDELLRATIELCRNSVTLHMRIEPKDIKRLQNMGIKLNAQEFNTYFYCEYVSEAPINVLEEYGIQSILVGARGNFHEERMGIKKYSIIYNKLMNLVKDIDFNMSDEEKFKIIYKRLSDMLDYDYETIGKNRIYSLENRNKSRNLENAVLLNRTVCVGFAEILKQTLSLVDIKCLICYSLEDKEGVSHAYNIVMLNGKWYNTDLTWDYLNVRKSKRPQYCLKSDMDFTDCDDEHDKIYHVPDDISTPKCYESLDIFREYKQKGKIINLLRKIIEKLLKKPRRNTERNISNLNRKFRESVRVIPTKKEKKKEMKEKEYELLK